MTTTETRLAAALADRYRVERELGAGGMATVFLAADVRHDRHVAIKVLHPDLAAALGGERFLDGSGWTKLTRDKAIDWAPVWSPDGRSVIFASDRGGTMGIWRLPVDERSGAKRGVPSQSWPAPTWRWICRRCRAMGRGSRFAR